MRLRAPTLLAALLMSLAHAFAATPPPDPQPAPPWLTALPPVPQFTPAASPTALRSQQLAIRKTLVSLLGALPQRPAQPTVRILSQSVHDGYRQENFEFDNGAGERVPGVLLIPTAPATSPNQKFPAILYCHWHGGEYDRGKIELFQTAHTPQPPGPTLARRGYVVLAIDAPCFGERHGLGPDRETRGAGELSASKLHLWYGRSLWGMLLRDDLIALDYLASRPEVDASRIGATGISMGATRTWWLMALDDRIRAGVAVACLTRYQDLIRSNGLKYHGIYYYVPGLLQHFDTEAIIAAIAPRALLCLNGDQDAGSPPTGIRAIESAAGPAWKTLGAASAFESRIYPGVGHVYTDDMWQRMLTWMDRHLAP